MSSIRRINFRIPLDSEITFSMELMLENIPRYLKPCSVNIFVDQTSDFIFVFAFLCIAIVCDVDYTKRKQRGGQLRIVRFACSLLSHPENIKRLWAIKFIFK